MQPPHSVMSPHSTIPILNFVGGGEGGCALFCVSGFVSVSLAGARCCCCVAAIASTADAADAATIITTTITVTNVTISIATTWI